MIWGMEDKVPEWMLEERNGAEVERRLQYMAKKYKDKYCAVVTADGHEISPKP